MTKEQLELFKKYLEELKKMKGDKKWKHNMK